MSTIETERLVLRQWRESDREPWATLNADPQVMEFFPSTLSRAEADEHFERHRQHIDEHGWGLWAVELKPSDDDPAGAAFIGCAGLAVPRLEADFTPCVELGWRLARRHWGRGYAPEAARAALDFAFDRLGLDEVVSFTAVANVKSRRVMEKIGMVERYEFDHPALRGHRLERHVLSSVESPPSGRPTADARP